MAAGRYNIVIQQGSTFERTITIKQQSTGLPVDLTGATFRGQVREYVEDTVPLASFLCTDVDLVNGKFKIALTATTTTSLNFDTGVYDVEIQYADTSVDRILQGTVTLSKEVTR